MFYKENSKKTFLAFKILERKDEWKPRLLKIDWISPSSGGFIRKQPYKGIAPGELSISIFKYLNFNFFLCFHKI